MSSPTDVAAASAPVPRLPRPVEGSALRDVERALELEWLEPDGAGGYAMGAVLGLATRRHHGLLVLRPPGLERRHVLLAGLGETVEHRGGAVQLDSLRRDGRFERLGHLALERFELEPLPTWTFRTGDLVVVRELLCAPGRVALRYTLRAGPERARLALVPRLAHRDADHVTRRNEQLDPTVTLAGGRVRVAPYAGLPALEFAVGGDGVEFAVAPRWEQDLEYPADLARGYAGVDDHWCPGTFTVDLVRGAAVVLTAGLELADVDPTADFERAAAGRRRALEGSDPGPRASLERAGRRFLYRDGERRGVIAGFPWLAEWGRDTFLALPGLTLAHGDLQSCAEVLEGAVDRLHHGLLPEHYAADPFCDHYGAVDTSLWFARAVRLYERAGGSRDLLERRLWPAVAEVGRSFLAGTDLGLYVDHDALLHVGALDVPTTWMDAQVEGRPLTPRHGYPVEVQALWYALVAHLEQHCYVCGGRREAERWGDLKRRAGAAFVQRFWDEERGVLLDVWRADDPDRSIRPNMVIAAALEHSPLTPAQRRRIVECAERELLTPRGLRSLSPDDPDYEGACVGGPQDRDRRRHQGSAWPYLLGFLIEARLRATGGNGPGLRRLEALLTELVGELDRGCLGSIGELYDGDPPHRPAETPAMAKSVAEIARGLGLIEGARG